MMRRVCLLGILLTSCAWLSAQQPGQPAPQEPPVFRTSSDLVTIDAVVTDADGQPVTDLTAADFEVTVSGKRQPLDQAVYIRTQDQPKLLAAARAAANQNSAAPEDERAKSPASRALNANGTTPDQVARTIAIVVDDLGLSFRSMFDTRNAIHQYIDTQIEPGDLVAIIRTAGGIGALQQFTTDKRLLHLAADRLVWDFRSRQGLGVFGPGETTGAEQLAALNSADWLQNSLASVGSLAALEFIAQGAAELPGRKCIVFFSEGFNQIFNDRQEGSQRIWDAMARMLARANAAGVVINTVDSRGLVALGVPGPVFANSDVRTRDGFRDPSITRIEGTSDAGSGNGYLDAPGHRMGAADTTNGRPFVGSRALTESQESLRFIANQTGGLAVDSTNDLNHAVTRILDDQQGYYLLGYTAPPGAARDGWDQNRVKVKVRRKGLQVRARQGFFGPFDGRPTATGAPIDPLVKSALSPFSSGQLTVRLTPLFGYDASTASPFVRSLLFIDPSDLQFEVDGTGRHTARVQVLLMAIGDNGQVVDSLKREVPLVLADEAFRRVSAHGLVVTMRSAVKQPGPYQMRTAVQDMTSNTIGSASQFLDVPAVGRGQLAMSGLIMKGTADDTKTPGGAPKAEVANGLEDSVLSEPEVRVFSPGVTALYAYEIYDGLKTDKTDLEAATSVIRNGKVVYQTEFTPVTTTAKSDGTMRTIPMVGTLAIGADMPVGAYTLEVIVRSGTGKKALLRKQSTGFEIRR
jgi:VWFA-related protein